METEAITREEVYLAGSVIKKLGDREALVLLGVAKGIELSRTASQTTLMPDERKPPGEIRPA